MTMKSFVPCSAPILSRSSFIVYVAHDGTEALNILRKPKAADHAARFDDARYGRFEVCRRTRQFSDIPIIFLSAKDDETDR